MKVKKLNIIIVLGLIATVGILIAQLFWIKETFNIEEKKFSQKAHDALLEVSKKLYAGDNNSLPSSNPVKKIANDYYIVNVENEFSPDVLEFYLKNEFSKLSLNTDYEYAVYNCQSDKMIYGKYISVTNKNAITRKIHFPKHNEFIYYFAIRFPNETTFLLNSIRFWLFLTLILLFILVIYVYSVYTIFQQKKYSELQRDFINNMTHEFKTPLSSILLASNYLFKQNEFQNNEKHKKYIQIIVDQSKKLNSHIEKILNIAKSDNAPLQLDIKPISILPIINNIIENIKLKQETASIKIKTILDDVTIPADEFHFSNIIYNLLDNAIKYCDDIPNIEINIKMTYTDLVISFCDNGIGIPPSKLPFIYDKFFRVSSSKKNEVNGFGLGLYYVHKICKLHHWKILTKNNIDKGITISIIIPAKQLYGKPI